MRARLSALKRADRLRVVGWIVLASGLIWAAGSCWIGLQSVDPGLDDTTALGYQRSFQHQMGQMMGPLGEILTEWQHALTSPLGEALLIAAGTALLAGCFFRVARVLDEDEDEDVKVR
jgi:hypothetical protein